MNLRATIRVGIAVAAAILLGLVYLYIRQGGTASSGNDAPSVLGREVGRLNRVVDERKDAALSLVAPPTNLDEARATKQALDHYLSFDGKGGIDWEPFRTWIAAQGKPETVAAFDHIWAERSASLDAYRRLVEGLASAQSESAGLWVDARRTEQYVTLYNAFEQNEDALYDWVVRLSAGDFK